MPIPSGWRLARIDALAQPRTQQPCDLKRLFDEVDQTGAIHAQFAAELTAIAWELGNSPAFFGTFVRTPGADEFDMELIRHQLPAVRIAALEDDEAPNSDELALWLQAFVERAYSDEAAGMFVAKGWRLHDARGRERLLVTLHADADSLYAIGGLFGSSAEAVSELRPFGALEWLW